MKDYEELGAKLKSRTTKVIISRLFQELRAKWRKIREVNVWLKAGCGRIHDTLTPVQGKERAVPLGWAPPAHDGS